MWCQIDVRRVHIDFFDKVKEGISKGVTTVSIKSKEMLEANKIKGQIDSLQKQKKGSLEELGNIIYSMFLEGKGYNEVTIKEECNVIVNLDTQISEKEEELRKVHLEAQEALGKQKVPQSVCTCGAEIPEGIKFCGKCGKKIDESENKIEGTEVTGKTCPHCGSQMAQDAKFCGKCGTEL
ncbi:MAG: zinc ribbon domain-containing protein [Proteobacteria bacterium]|nr:zinc ribbon domain-containing protein [Pseudomonadota bacterium]